MTTTTQPVTIKAWAEPLAKPAQEFSPTVLPIISGQIPTEIRGSLYRNGPGRVERGGMPVGHWFDGDGAILGIHFTDRGATGVYRYVQTTGYKAEAAANKLLYPNYGMKAPGAIWNTWFRPVKNAANTSVLALPDKLLALWEGGNPYVLDLQNLETLGQDDLGGLSNNSPYSAHYKQHPQTKEIFNFGVTPGPKATLHIYKSNPSGRIIQKVAHQLDGVPALHDFVLAGEYLIFCIPPVRLNLLSAVVGLKAYSDAWEWQPSKGTQILVVDCNTLEVVSRSETEPWFQWHFANGYVDDGTVVVDLVRYEDFQTNQYLKEVATGETHTPAPATLSRIKIHPQTGKVTSMEKLADQACEFPVVAPQRVGHSWRYTYLSIYKPGTDLSRELLNSLARFDNQTGTLVIADPGENRYPSEPILVSSKENPELGWILTVVYDGNSHQSEVWIYENSLLEEPICQLRLPSVIPPSFHGTWMNALLK